MSQHLNTLAERMIPVVEHEMREVLALEQKRGDPFFGMMHYHMGWADAELLPANVNGGKRVRPLLCLLACAAAGGDWVQAVPAAAALELLHNFTLIHDDIQDASPTRRGRPTLWQLWGANQAINSGDAMFALAHIAMSRLLDRDVPAPIVVRSLRRLDETCLDLTRGQHADMDFENRTEVSVEEYLAMIDGKTAALLSLSAELGARVARCDADIVSRFASFGRELGLAFQVRDDILGIWGDEAIIGKSAATDIVTRKKSLPILYGLSRSAQLRQLYQGDEDGTAFVTKAVDLLEDVGARSFAESYEQRYASSAIGHLEATQPQGNAGEALTELTHSLLNRRV
ncbi:MAG: polyprenyl synthetase family protein [Candidatus Promineifilaceae bacterium]|nr:polyprenyl synthetase family protein [Candidatus Promineifilaceae bacterium]